MHTVYRTVLVSNVVAGRVTRFNPEDPDTWHDGDEFHEDAYPYLVDQERPMDELTDKEALDRLLATVAVQAGEIDSLKLVIDGTNDNAKRLADNVQQLIDVVREITNRLIAVERAVFILQKEQEDREDYEREQQDQGEASGS